jgi:leucine dehydrogenase
MVNRSMNLEDFHEQIHVIDDPASGAHGVIALHSLVLGPAAGGCRFWRYPNHQSLIEDAVRLARGMTFKNALAGLPFGGGKAVLQMPAGDFDRRALFRSFGDAVAKLAGRYVTAEDVGTGVDDMMSVFERTHYVAGLRPRSGKAGGDPSPWTAMGVFEAMGAAARFACGAEIGDMRVAVQGAGHVGAALCKLLASAGATVIVADVDTARARQVADSIGGTVMDPDAILAADVDIVAPCALGAVLTDVSVADLRATIICGAANNQLDRSETAALLDQRGILYAPDYVVNSGGIINVAAEYLGEGEDGVRDRIAGIPARLTDILAASRSEGRSTVEVADAKARAVIASAWSRAA